MGNCLKHSSADDISLLRNSSIDQSIVASDPADQISPPAASLYHTISSSHDPNYFRASNACRSQIITTSNPSLLPSFDLTSALPQITSSSQSAALPSAGIIRQLQTANTATPNLNLENNDNEQQRIDGALYTTATATTTYFNNRLVAGDATENSGSFLSQHLQQSQLPHPSTFNISARLMYQRLGVIQHLPAGRYNRDRISERECAICMEEFRYDDMVRALPCQHVFHCDCIDIWLLRRMTCPTCVEPVDAALLNSYENN